jgi:hypothetical protein
VVAVLVVTLIAAGTYGLWQANAADSDGDGFTDRVEASGWLTQDGSEHRTDPYQADTDGDGLTDGDEAGALVPSASSADVYSGYSDPLIPDTDGDGLADGGEADLGLNPHDGDSDDDTLADGYEVDVVGSAPDAVDTDGDGFNDGYEDANRDSRGLDPLWPDEEVSTLTYVTEFTRGAVAGDLWPGDSLAWLAGNLASGAASSVVGPVIGGAADLRDALGSAINGDWVGAGYNALGFVPGGDVMAIPEKAAKFIARHPKLAAAAARIIARTSYIPDTIKLRAARLIYPNWDDLVQAGANENELLLLLKGRTNLDDLGRAFARRTHVVGVPVRPAPTDTSGKELLQGLLRATGTVVLSQVRASTVGCATGCNGDVRIFDVVIDGVAHEAKVGYVSWSGPIQIQIRKDAWLIETGQIRGAHWHFLPSSGSNTVGADPRVYDLLDEVGILYTIHLPTGR